MQLNRPLTYAAVGVLALAFGFVLAAQIRATVINPSDRVAQNQALVRSVQDLESTNSADRGRIAALREEIARLEAQAAGRSSADAAAAQALQALRAHAGLLPLTGPGLTVSLRDGDPATDPQTHNLFLVSYQDVQDVVNALFAGGAEAVSVNGHRISPLSYFRGAGTEVLVDQAPPMQAPFTISAIGDQERLVGALEDPASLVDLRSREERYRIGFSWQRASGLRLPAYDSALTLTYAHAG